MKHLASNVGCEGVNEERSGFIANVAWESQLPIANDRQWLPKLYSALCVCPELRIAFVLQYGANALK